MKVEIRPSALIGRVEAPPSKSMAHRLLICAGLAKGNSRIQGISDSEDMLATLDLLYGLGASFQKDGNRVQLCGIDPQNAKQHTALSCRECGSTLRFFLPICLLSSEKMTLCGSERLFARSLGVYENLCRERGLYWKQEKASVTVQGPLCGGEFIVAGNVSSQFISGLLFALPLCKEDSVIRILPPLESRPYIDMTIEALARFGVVAEWVDELTISVQGNQAYCARELSVEGDYSNAAFFEALRVLGHDITVENLDPASLQGDKIYLQYFSELERGTPTLSIRHCPDLGPILIALAATQNGALLTDTERLRIKESDRGTAMAEELAKLGVQVEVRENEIFIPKATLSQPKEELCGHNDHRIVMALAVLLTKIGGVINGAQAVKKSLPEFFTMLKALGSEVTLFEAE